jgi:hypothetical protein
MVAQLSKKSPEFCETRSFVTKNYVEFEGSLRRIVWNPKVHYQNSVEPAVLLPRIMWNLKVCYQELYGIRRLITQSCVCGTLSFIIQNYVVLEGSLPRIMRNPNILYPKLCETQSLITQNYVETENFIIQNYMEPPLDPIIS